MPVNPRFPEPQPPGPWVGPERCVCGATYAQHRAYPSFAEACERIRVAAGDREESGGGGYRSRGAALWVMRTMKLQDWYATHQVCGEDWAEVQDERLVDGHGKALF